MASLDDLNRATSAYEDSLSAVGDDQWNQPSSCSGWTVKDLADHVTGGNRFAVSLLAGATMQDAFTEALSPGFDGNPLLQYQDSASAQIAAFAKEGALSTIVDHPAGQMDGATFLGLRLGDLLLHRWDLARSTGGDDTLDEGLVRAVWEAYEPRLAGLARSGMFGAGASGQVTSEAPLSTRLLDATGRRPAP